MGSATRDSDEKPWRTILIALGIAAGVLILIPTVPMALWFGLEYIDDWNDAEYARITAKVDREMLAAGFLPPVPNATSYPREPDFVVSSPDRAWAFTAEWVDTRGYNWGITSKRTGRTFFRIDPIRPDNSFNPRINALWSPDSSYVAITSSLGGDCEFVEVVRVADPQPHATELSECTAITPDNDLLNRADTGQLDGSFGTRSEALGWENNTDLSVIVYSHVKIKDGSERDIGLHEVIRFHGDSYEIQSRFYDFYETRPDRF